MGELNLDTFYEAVRALQKTNVPMSGEYPFISDFNFEQPVATTASLDLLDILEGLAVEGKKENTMSRFNDDYDCCASATAAVVTVSDESKQRSYLGLRIQELLYEHRNALEEQFYISAPSPKTLQEMSDWLKAGHYTVRDLDKEPTRGISYWTDSFSWREKPADYAGYTKAEKALEAASQVAEDAAALTPIADAFDALKTLEAWTYTPAA